jgi:hypothetical protein
MNAKSSNEGGRWFRPGVDVIAAIARGELVVVVDDERRENEGDLIVAAEKVTPEAINFMARHGRGLICVAMEREATGPAGPVPHGAARRWAIPSAPLSWSRWMPATASAPASAPKTGRTRWRPWPAMPARRPTWCGPGTSFRWKPWRAGVLRRPGHTEAAVDLARLAGLKPAGVICEVLQR